MHHASNIRTISRSAVGISLMFFTACHAAGSTSGDSSRARDLGRIGTVMQQVEDDYVHPISEQQLTTNALKGMLTRLDPHSDYMDAAEYREFSGDTRGRFGGLGMELSESDGLPKVISPIDGTPAARAGIEPGDLITKIDGRPTDGMDLLSIVENLRGKPGTDVTLTITRALEAPFDVELTRAIINVASVKSVLEPGKIGYVRITMFSADTPAEFKDAMKSLAHEAGGRLNGLVLDLRDDPGGLLGSAVDVAGDFLDGGTIVSTRGRASDDNHIYTAPPTGDMIPGIPMVVIVNVASASASEIVAGALQNRHRATVIGTPSFGKGSVQTIFPLADGGALRLTTALYYTPDGRSLQDEGVVPNIMVGVPAKEQSADAVITREVDLHGALKNSGPVPQRASDDFDHPIMLSLIGTAQDAQLAAALHYLKGLTGQSSRQ